MNIGYLKDFRESKGLTKTDFAKSIDCAQSTYTDFENKKGDYFIVNKLAKLVQVYPDFNIFTFLDVENPFITKEDAEKERKQLEDSYLNKTIECINLKAALEKQQQTTNELLQLFLKEKKDDKKN